LVSASQQTSQRQPPMNTTTLLMILRKVANDKIVQATWTITSSTLLATSSRGGFWGCGLSWSCPRPTPFSSTTWKSRELGRLPACKSPDPARVSTRYKQRPLDKAKDGLLQRDGTVPLYGHLCSPLRKRQTTMKNADNVFRGGSWNALSAHACRYRYARSKRTCLLGFRCTVKISPDIASEQTLNKDKNP